MCIEDEDAGRLQRMRIVKEIEVRLIPSLLNCNVLKGSTVQMYCKEKFLGIIVRPCAAPTTSNRPNSAFQYLGRFLEIKLTSTLQNAAPIL